jgi:AcrR family transcriptional regulator
MLKGYGCPAGMQGANAGGKKMAEASVLNRQAERSELPADQDNAKRRQIIEGARQVFMTQGFDAASMNEIARAAGVSKGTLYVYFQNKEQLFEAIVGHECREQGERIFALDPEDHDIEGVLTRLGLAFVEFLCRPARAPKLRTVIAIAERMPDLGRRFYETGPAFGLAQMTTYLNAQVAAGVLAIEDCQVAAAQFLDSCAATLFKPILFNCGEAPTPERTAHVVKIAVRTFLAAYRVR